MVGEQSGVPQTQPCGSTPRTLRLAERTKASALVARIGFEPMISAVRERRLEPLGQRAMMESLVRIELTTPGVRIPFSTAELQAQGWLRRLGLEPTSTESKAQRLYRLPTTER